MARIALAVLASATETHYFSIGTAKEIHPERALAALVKRDGHAEINHFCVVGLKGDHYSMAEVYWRENNTLTLWESDGRYDTDTLLMSRRTWNLKKDVVPLDEDIKGSTYLLSQREVDEDLAACQRVGRNFVIRRARPKR